MAVVEVAFVAKARSGGGAGTTILVTIPKDVVRLFDVKDGDYLQLKLVKNVGKEKLPKLSGRSRQTSDVRH